MVTCSRSSSAARRRAKGALGGARSEAIRELDRMIATSPAERIEGTQPDARHPSTVDAKVEKARRDALHGALRDLSRRVFDELPMCLATRSSLRGAGDGDVWRSIDADLDEAIEQLADQNNAPVAGILRRMGRALDAELTQRYGDSGVRNAHRFAGLRDRELRHAVESRADDRAARRRPDRGDP